MAASLLVTYSGLTLDSTSGRTHYFGTVANSTGSTEANESVVQTYIRTAGTLSNLTVNISANANNNNTYVALRVDGANGNQVITVPTTATGFFEDTTSTDDVSGDELINYKFDSSGVGDITLRTYSILFTATTNTTVCLRNVHTGTNNYSTDDATYFFIMAGTDAVGTTNEAINTYLFATAGTLNNLQVKISNNARTTNTVFRSRVAGSDGNLVVTVAAGQTGIFEDTTNSDTIADDNLVAYSMTLGTDGSANVISGIYIGADFTTTNSSFPVIAGGSRVINYNGTNYVPLGGRIFLSTTESDVQVDASGSYTISNLYAYISANSVSANSTITFRKEGADTTLTVTIGSDATGAFEDAVHTVDVVDTDLIDYCVVTGNNATSMTARAIGVLATVSAGGGTEEISGSINIACSLTGSLSVSKKLTSSCEANVQIAGSLDKSIIVKGTVDVTTSLNGSLSIAKQLSSSLEVITSLSGNISLSKNLSGSIVTETSLSGTLNTQGQINLSGSISSGILLSGTLNVTKNLTGSISSTSAIFGNVSNVRSLSGEVNVNTNITGVIIRKRIISGGIVTTTSLSGSFSVIKLLRSSIEVNVVIGTGSLDILGETSLSGQVLCQTSINGTLIIAKSLSGQINSNVIVAGSLFVGGEVVLSGSILVNSIINGTLTRTTLFAGSVNAVTEFDGLLKLVKSLSGQINTNTSLSGAMFRNRLLSGNVDVSSQLIANMIVQWAMSGQINATANLTGTLGTQAKPGWMVGGNVGALNSILTRI